MAPTPEALQKLRLRYMQLALTTVLIVGVSISLTTKRGGVRESTPLDAILALRGKGAAFPSRLGARITQGGTGSGWQWPRSLHRAPPDRLGSFGTFSPAEQTWIVQNQPDSGYMYGCHRSRYQYQSRQRALQSRTTARLQPDDPESEGGTTGGKGVPPFEGMPHLGVPPSGKTPLPSAEKNGGHSHDGMSDSSSSSKSGGSKVDSSSSRSSHTYAAEKIDKVDKAHTPPSSPAVAKYNQRLKKAASFPKNKKDKPPNWRKANDIFTEMIRT
mmetsp:Transcript_31159/g.54778  ORF Transcript_31159/g.54778 Transcript_31159/m.54778 type:complete len:271 (+) Transcript_31159:27-839(+)